MRVTCMHACAHMPVRLLAAWLHIGAKPVSVHESVRAQAQPHDCTFVCPCLWPVCLSAAPSPAVKPPPPAVLRAQRRILCARHPQGRKLL